MQIYHFRIKFYATNTIFLCVPGETLIFCEIKFGHKKKYPLHHEVLALMCNILQILLFC